MNTLKTAIFCTDPMLARTLEMLGPHIGFEGQPPACLTDADPNALSITVREQTRGSAFVIIGVGRIADGKDASRMLLAASRSHSCALALTLEGYRGLIDGLDELHTTDRGLLKTRVKKAILIGDYERAFVEMKTVFPGAHTRHIGGVHWADTTCEQIAAYIKSDLAPQAA